MIDELQSLLSTKPDKPLSSIKKPIEQCDSPFIHTLLPLVNRQPTNKSQRSNQNTYTGNPNDSLELGKLIKALPDPPIFTDKKDLSID